MLAFSLLLFGQKPKTHHAPSVKMSSNYNRGLQRASPFRPPWQEQLLLLLHSCPFNCCPPVIPVLHPLSYLSYQLLPVYPWAPVQSGDPARAPSWEPCKLDKHNWRSILQTKALGRGGGGGNSVGIGLARQLLGCPVLSSMQAWSWPASPGQPRWTKLNHLEKNRPPDWSCRKLECLSEEVITPFFPRLCLF